MRSGKGRKANDRSVKTYLMGQPKNDEQSAYEKAEHLAILNKLEILQKEIDGTKHHLAELQQEVDILEEDKNDLQELFEYEERILDAAFNGRYGSERENKLEDELSHLQLVLTKIEEANFKWRQAQVMIEYACRQIGTAVDKWEEIMKLSATALESKYKLAEETRNNLIAAGQNLQGAHRYLPHIKFPYCTPEEIEMLNKATSYVFTDMQAKARQSHARDAYSAAHKRSAALLQWFNETINTLIKDNLSAAKDKVKKKAHELRTERVNLIKFRMKELYNKDIEVSSADLNFDSNSEMGSLSPHDKSRNESGQSVTRGSYSNLSYSNVPNAPSPLPRDELAPLPTKEELFGKIEHTRSDHDNNKNTWEKDAKTGTSHTKNNEPRMQRRGHQTRFANDGSLQSNNRSISNNYKNQRNNSSFRHPLETEMLEDVDGDIMAHKYGRRNFKACNIWRKVKVAPKFKMTSTDDLLKKLLHINDVNYEDEYKDPNFLANLGNTNQKRVLGYFTQLEKRIEEWITRLSLVTIAVLLFYFFLFPVMRNCFPCYTMYYRLRDVIGKRPNDYTEMTQVAKKLGMKMPTMNVLNKALERLSIINNNEDPETPHKQNSKDG